MAIKNCGTPLASLVPSYECIRPSTGFGEKAYGSMGKICTWAKAALKKDRQRVGSINQQYGPSFVVDICAWHHLGESISFI